MDFKESLIKYYNFSEGDWQQTIRRFEPETIPAKEYFLEKGKVANRLGYLSSGLLRSFFYDDHANDITTHFFKPGTVVISMESFNKQVPSKEYVITLEESELLVTTREKMQEL